MILILEVLLILLDLPLLLQLPSIVISDSRRRVLYHSLPVIIILALLDFVPQFNRRIVLLAKVLLVPPLPIFHRSLVVHVVVAVLVHHVFVDVPLLMLEGTPLALVVVQHLLELVVDLVLHLVQLLLLHVVDVCFELQVLLQLLLLCHLLLIP